MANLNKEQLEELNYNSYSNSFSIILSLQVRPSSKTQSFLKNQSGEWLLKIRERPVDGQANDAVIEFLADELHIPKTDIQIIKGQKNKLKLVQINFFYKPQKNAEYFQNLIHMLFFTNDFTV